MTLISLPKTLDSICDELQLSRTQYESATRSYLHVGEWLADERGALARFNPTVFPHGSMLLGTTSKPVGRDDHDLDGVCNAAVDPYRVSGAQLNGWMRERLREHGDLAQRLSSEPPCLRLSYTPEHFHLEFVAACPDPSRPAALLIPRDASGKTSYTAPIDSWKPTDPQGYARWFASKCARTLLEKAAVAPPPDYETAVDKHPLKKNVILFKRRRDEYYGGRDRPSSILLTTLAAEAYNGAPFDVLGLHAMVAAVRSRVAISCDSRGRLIVPNPVDPSENLGALLSANDVAFLCQFLDAYAAELVVVSRVKGLPALREAVLPMFGQATVTRAFQRMAGDAASAKAETKLATDPMTGVLALASSSPGHIENPAHVFHGDP